MFALALKASFGVFILILASSGVGYWLIRNFAGSFSQFNRFVFGLLGGFGLLSLILFIVGQFSFTRKTISIVLGSVILVSAKPLLGLKKHTSFLVTALGEAPKIPLFLVATIVSLTALIGLGEVTGDWNNDTVAYHLLGPKVWLRNGVIRPVPDNSHTAFPQTAETMYGVLLGIGGERAPRFLSFVTFGMLLLATASLALACGLSVRESWWLAALTATMPAVY